RRGVRPAVGCLVWEHGAGPGAGAVVLYLGWLQQLRQLSCAAEGQRIVLFPGYYLAQDASGADAQRLHDRARVVFLRVERRRWPQVLWAQQRHRPLEREEDSAPEARALNGQARRVGGTCDAVLDRSRRERARPVWR